MIELKKKINEIIKKLNQDWVNTIKNAENDGIDLSEMISKTSQYSEDLDNAFMEYHTKSKDKNKKSIWG